MLIVYITVFNKETQAQRDQHLPDISELESSRSECLTAVSTLSTIPPILPVPSGPYVHPTLTIAYGHRCFPVFLPCEPPSSRRMGTVTHSTWSSARWFPGAYPKFIKSITSSSHNRPWPCVRTPWISTYGFPEFGSVDCREWSSWDMFGEKIREKEGSFMLENCFRR